MNKQQLTEKVKQTFLREAKINIDAIEPNTELTTLDIDSLDILKVAAALEKTFNITISTAELTQISTLADIIGHLERKIGIQD